MTLRDQLTSTELRAMQELQDLLNKKREAKIREAMGADQSDIDFAFEADRTEWSDPAKAGTLP